MNADTEVVIDASTIIASLTLEKDSGWASGKLAQYGYFHILDLTHYEVANALLNKAKKKELTKEQAEATLEEATRLMNLFGVHEFSSIVKDGMRIGLETGISEYDASYLYLAKLLDMKLITGDIKLARRLKNTKYYKLVECPDN